MMTKLLLGGLLSLALVTGNSFAANPHGADRHNGHSDSEGPVLPGGNYAANVGNFACAKCPSLIKKTLLGINGIGSASVDKKTKEVRFTVKEKASVKWSDIQKALKASAQKIGKGADFTLSNFRIDDHHGAKANNTTDKTMACCSASDKTSNKSGGHEDGDHQHNH